MEILVSFLMNVIFHNPPELLLPKLEFSNSSLPKLGMGRVEETQPQEHQHLSPILLDLHHSSPNVFKNYEKSDVDKKTQACKTRRAQ